MAKSAREKFQMNSTGVNASGKPTGYNKVIQLKKGQELELKMFDPRAVVDGKRGQHVLFKKGKLKK